MGITEIVSGLATLAWLAAIGALGYTVFTAARGRGTGQGITVIVVAVVAALALTIGAAGIVIIGSSERAVVISPYVARGYKEETLGSGLHWITPGESVARYSFAKQNYTMSSTTSEGQVAGDDSIQVRTKDGQQVQIDASVIYFVNPDQVLQLHLTWQNRFEEGLVRTQSRGIIRDIASQYGVEEIVSTKRAEMEQSITEALATVFSANSLTLDDFIVRNIRFSDEYAAAVEQKQIAEQQAQQAAFVVEQKRQEAEQARQVAEGVADAAVIAAEADAKARLIQAEAEARALELISAALKDNPDLLQYRYIEKLAPNVQVMYLPSGQSFLVPLPEPNTTVTTPVTTTVVP